MTRISGRRGMGSHKHAVSGKAGPSPKLKMAMKLAGERGGEQGKKKPRNPMKSTIKDLFVKQK